MKSLNVVFTDKEFKALEKAKQKSENKHNWHDFLLYAALMKKEEKAENDIFEN